LSFPRCSATISFAQDVTGDWNGTLHANGAELRLVLHISKNPDGGLKATLDSVDQGANGISSISSYSVMAPVFAV